MPHLLSSWKPTSTGVPSTTVVLAWPPTWPLFSKMVTLWPPLARADAADKPEMPEPTMATFMLAAEIRTKLADSERRAEILQVGNLGDQSAEQLWAASAVTIYQLLSQVMCV